jgi:hypothetical protein
LFDNADGYLGETGQQLGESLRQHTLQSLSACAAARPQQGSRNHDRDDAEYQRNEQHPRFEAMVEP